MQLTLLVRGHRCVNVPRSNVTANVQMLTFALFRFAARPSYPAVGIPAVRPACGAQPASGSVASGIVGTVAPFRG